MDIRLKILEDREKRLEIISDKINSTNNLIVTIKANICGNDKNIEEANIVLNYFIKKVLKKFDVISYEKVNSYDGDFYLVELNESNYNAVKIKLVEIESLGIGRFVDLDLFKNGEKSITRTELGLPKRRCIICDGEYNTCLREKRHTLDEVLKSSKEQIRSLFIENLIFNTKKSLIAEVTAHPKFGLVTKLDNGKHKDMDYSTFIKSIEVLVPYFREYAVEGFEFSENTFPKLREIGKRAEDALFEATGGINTYKGIIFLLGILLPSIVDVVFKGKYLEDISENIKLLCNDILDDFKDIDKKEKLTYGEKIYLDYGITGIRGVAHSGIEIAFKLVDRFSLKTGINDLVIDILLNCMANIDDTVILHKSKIETLQYVKKKSSELLELGFYSNNEEEFEAFTKECIELNISPGGSADIVTVILLLLKIKEDYVLL